MSLYEYTEQQQLLLVKSVSMLNNVYQKDNTLYWRQDRTTEGDNIYIAVDLNWMRIEFNQQLPEGTTEHTLSTSYNLQSMVITYLANAIGWERYPVTKQDITEMVISIKAVVDVLKYEDTKLIVELAGLESIIDDFIYWPKEQATIEAKHKVKRKIIKYIQRSVEEEILASDI